ncbi:uncharacterized protein LOC143044650 [Mytilus galloprovincialis]|uniref:uncharacterized protein LOC143044650 n=1 Tax=Mytilus galloprovincialis TaxID=29158 RepID=UPI003F7C802D
MEIFNRKLNMINIAGLIILLLLVKHGNATTSAPVASTTKISTTTSKITATTLLTTGPTTNSSTTPSKSPSVNTSLTTKVEVSATTVTTSPTTITTLPTTKAPDECYEISCSSKNVNCTVNVDNLVIVQSTVKKCPRKSNGSCYAKRTVDSTKANITNYALGCSAVKCDSDELNITVTGTVNVTTGCCQGNLCNGVPTKNDGQMVNYNFLLSVLCIAMLTIIKG